MAQLVVIVPGQLLGPAAPVLTRLHGSGDTAGYRRLLLQSVGLVLAVAMAGALALALASPLIVRAYGPGFARGASTLAIAAFASATGGVSMVFRGAMLATGRAWLQNAYALMWSVALIAAFIPLRRFGSVGLANSYLVAFGVVALAQAIGFIPALRFAMGRRA